MSVTPEKPLVSARILAEPQLPLHKRWGIQFAANSRRIGSVAMAAFALFLAWTVVTGRNGLTSWNQKRAEDKALTQEIEQLTDENARLGQHVDRLRIDPGAIEHEARERLHYARPNEIIYALPVTTQAERPSKK